MERSGRRDLLAFAGLALGLLAWFSVPGIVGGFVFPVGPDAPVYLWWTRLVGVEGLSSVTRPGVPALALVLAGTFGASVSAVLAALEIVGGVLIGVAAAGLVRIARPDDRSTWVLAGVLTGTFAVHVATGYLATIVFGVLFLAAAAAIATRTRRGAAVAAALLGAGAIAHPRFLAVGAAILVLTAALAWRDDRAEARRILAAVLGGAGILAVAGLALLAGPSPLLADTSRDAFLRRAGLDDILHRAYLSRFTARWTRYAPWGAVPLALLAVRPGRPRTTVERMLVAWVAVAAGGALFSVATGLLPVDRFVTFAFAVPMLAAIGAMRVARQERIHRGLARTLAAALAVAMLAGAGSAWLRQEPFVDERDLTALRVANAIAVAAPSSALVVPIGSEQSAFLLTLSGNAVRATVPPTRIRDVAMTVLGTSPGREAAAMVELTAGDERAAIDVRGGRAQRILVVPFAERDARSAPWTPVTEDVAVDPLPAGFTPTLVVDPVEPYAPGLPTAIAIAALGLLGAIGWSWTRIAGIADTGGLAALAPATGMGVALLAAFVLERVGLPLAGAAGPFVVSAVGVASGPIARWILDRRDRVSGGTGARP